MRHMDIYQYNVFTVTPATDFVTEAFLFSRRQAGRWIKRNGDVDIRAAVFVSQDEVKLWPGFNK